MYERCGQAALRRGNAEWDLDSWGAEYFDPAYLATADGIQEMREMYDGVPLGVFPMEGGRGGERMRANPLMNEMPVFQRLSEYVRGFYSLRLRTELETSLHAGKINLHCGDAGNIPVAVSGFAIENMYQCRGVENDPNVVYLRRDSDDPVVQVDVIMSAEVSMPDTAGPCQNHVAQDRLNRQRMAFRAVTYLNLLTENLATSRICLNGDAPRQKGMPLDDHLVPYVRLQDMDREAERMLRGWFPSMAGRDGRLDTRRLLEKLGMEVRFVRITKELKFQGRVFFEDCETEVYDGNGRAMPFYAKKGTLLVDERIAGRPEAVLWTIIHEIYHFVQHREFFYLQRLYNRALSFISCDVQDYRKLDRNSPLYWVEWQTERITARLVIPKDPAKRMAEMFLKSFSDLGKTPAMEKTIRAMADYYHVSRQTAKYRMVELGFAEARGVFNYVDKGYVPAYYGFDEGRHGGTPDIPQDAALKLYISNQEFRALIDTGRFLFVENHFCLNRQAYISRGKNGEPCLTAYAREHIEECCIIFRRDRGGSLYSYTTQALNNEIIYRGPELYRPLDIPADKPMDMAERMSRRLKIYMEAMEHTPLRFGPALQYHRKSRGFTQETLAELVSISDRQVKKYEGGMVRKPAQRTVIAMCIAMKLEADLSDEMLKKAGCTPGTEEEDLVLAFVLHALVEYSVPYCDRFLISRNLAPLTSSGEDAETIAS